MAVMRLTRAKSACAWASQPFFRALAVGNFALQRFIRAQ